MKKILSLAACAVLLVGLSACLEKAKGVEVTEAYAFATTEAQKNGAVFLSAKNNTDKPVVITGASAANTETVELHTMSMENNVMEMRKVEKFDVAAGESLTLEPTGNHIMLMGLKGTLNAGEAFPLTLQTDAGDVAVEVKIVSPGTTP